RQGEKKGDSLLLVSLSPCLLVCLSPCLFVKEFPMATKYQVEDIRTVALVGHGGSGKTSLTDALLYKARAVDRRRSVDEGTTFGKACVLFNAPVGTGGKLTGVVSVLDPPSPAPALVPIDLDAERLKLIDAVVESDDALMEEFLTEGSLPKEKLLAAVPKALAA